MVKGYGSQIDKYQQNFTSVGSMQEGKQFGASPAVAPVPLLKNTSVENLRPLAQDTVQVGEQIPVQPAPVEGDLFGDLKYTLPLWYVFGKGVDLYNHKCSGEYLDSLPAKIARLGDRIAESKVAKSDFVKNVQSKISNITNEFVGRIKGNSTLVRNLMENSTVPEWKMPLHSMLTQEQELANTVNETFERYLNAGGRGPKLSNLAPTAAEKEFLRNIFPGKASTLDKVNALQLYRSNPAKYKDALSINAVLSQRMTNSNVIKETLLKELGYDVATYEKYVKNPEKYVKELREFAQKAGKNMQVYHGNYTIGGALFRRKVDMSQIANKMISISKDAGNLPPKTALGRGMSKTMQGLMRGLTWGGGKLGLLIMVVPALVDMVKNAKEAPDDQRAGTIAHGLVEAVSWVATFPLSMHLMHKIGGLKYLGMTKNQVSCYRDALEKFKQDNIAGKFTTEKMYNDAWQKVKDIRKPSTKLNIFEKGLKYLGMGITNDLEMRPGWKDPNLKGLNSIKNAFRFKSITNKLRNLTGIARVPLFFVTMGYVLSPLITKPLEWIFGKPYDRHEEEAKRAEAEQARMEAAMQQQMAQGQIQQPQAADIVIPAPNVVQQAQPNQSLDDALAVFNQKMKAAPMGTAQVKSQQQVVNENRYIPSQSCGIPRDSGEFNERTYMPNQDNQVVKLPEEINGLNIIEQRAKRAEDLATDILSKRP